LLVNFDEIVSYRRVCFVIKVQSLNRDNGEVELVAISTTV